MRNLVIKEFKLVAHPTTFIFLLLSAMMLIPNYPYYVTFFYTSLGIYFTFLSARENHDVTYTMLLPLRKKDIVKAKFVFVIIIEIVQVIIAIPFAVIRRTYSLPNNQVGIEANIAFFGFALIMLGIFNLIFFTKYYKNTNKVGAAFSFATISIVFFMIVAEVSIHAIPFMKNKIDTMDPKFIGPKLIILLVGAIVYILFSIISYKRSVKFFEKFDI